MNNRLSSGSSISLMASSTSRSIGISNSLAKDEKAIRALVDQRHPNQ